MNLTEFRTANHLTLGTTLVVVGTNPEWADYDNPRGEIINVVYWVEAVTPEGRIYRHNHRFSKFHREDLECQKEAEKLLAKIQLFVDNGGKLNPGHWEIDNSRVVYGSELYQSEGWEEDTIAWERNAEDAFSWRCA